jgi:Nif-specific regulatory protein
MEAAEETIIDSLSKRELDFLSKEDLSVLLDVSNTLNSTLDFEEILHRVLERLTEMVHAQASSIWLIDELSPKLHVASAIGERSEDIKKVPMNIGQGIVGQVVKTGHPRLIPDARSEPAHARYIARQVNFEARTMLCIPMFYKDKVIGAIQALNKANGKHFNENDLRRVSVFANLAGIAIENARLYDLSQKENINLRMELGRGVLEFDDIIGKSPKLMELHKKARIVAQRDSNLLLLGESGTGKGILAQAIHHASPRARGPFIDVNCGAIPKDLFESELFGHKKGSFTTAIKDKSGQFELANGGTIFLDEVGDTPLDLQVKLLNAIENKRFLPIGGTTQIETDVRVIAATNQNLEVKMKEGEFREDLYYRLSVIDIYVPPLRERREDIPLLAEHFLEKYNRETNRRIKKFSPAAISILINYNWPGNIRELANTIERTVVFANSDIIQASDLTLHHPKIQTKIEEDENYNDRMDKALKQFKKKHITKILKQTNGNRTLAAQKLEIQRTYLSRLIKELDVDA